MSRSTQFLESVMKQTLQLDKYAADAKTWRIYAQFNLDASRVLFTHENALTLCFPAATLGHRAIEALLKTAMIREGMTIFDPGKLKQLDGSVALGKDQCVWGHDLVKLGKLLASKRSDFDLLAELIGFFFPHKMPMTIEDGLAMFDPFFWELRYPQRLERLESIGPDDYRVLDALVDALEPFAGKL